MKAEPLDQLVENPFQIKNEQRINEEYTISSDEKKELYKRMVNFFSNYISAFIMKSYIARLKLVKRIQELLETS